MRNLSWVLILAAFATATPSLTAQTKWESVVSKEGQFSVEMPVKPAIKPPAPRDRSN